MLGPVCILGIVAFDRFGGDRRTSRDLTEIEAQKIISERASASFTVYQFKKADPILEIRLPEDHRIESTPWNDSLRAALTAKRIPYLTLIEGQDLRNSSIIWLVMLSVFIVVTGIVLLLCRPGRGGIQPSESNPSRAWGIGRMMAVCGALAMLVMSFVILSSTLYHQTFKSISGAAARKMIAAHEDTQFELFQYKDGSGDLWITPHRSLHSHYPAFVAPADAATLALLADNKIAYKTWVQGRDFGFRGPSLWLSLLVISVLLTGAVFNTRRIPRLTFSRTRRQPMESSVHFAAIAFPAIQPVVHAAWKLNPPVMPSMSSSSPAKNSPGQTLLSIVLKFTSPNRTPPHVTNSSWFRLLPVTGNSVRINCWTSWCCAARESAIQRVSRAMPAVRTSCSHKRNGNGVTGTLTTRRAGCATWRDLSSAAIASA
jgi:hypothetical protein